jgi:hypothetical protein
MSVIALSPLHYNSVQMFLLNRFHRSDELSIAALRTNGISTETELEKLVEIWYELNLYSYKYRYNEHDIFKDTHNEVVFTEISAVGAIKALQSIVYQIEIDTIAEGREITPQEQKAFDILKEIITELILQTIRKIPQYEEAKWVIE